MVGILIKKIWKVKIFLLSLQKIIKTMKIKLTKLAELEDALYPNNIETGYETIREVNEQYFEKPQVGRRFNVGTFSTSGVQQIIGDNTFKTYSSIYRWEIITE